MSKDYKLEKRKYVISGFIILIVAIYIVRLFNLQVSDDKYKINAESNAFLKRTIYPARGLIYDRNGELVVFNQPAYDVMLIPKDVEKFDTATFCKTLGITREELRQKWADMKDHRRNPGYSAYTPQNSYPTCRRKITANYRRNSICFPAFIYRNVPSPI